MKERILIGQYQVVDEIGSGGNAMVYRVKSTDGHEYALKQLHKNARNFRFRFRPL